MYWICEICYKTGILLVGPGILRYSARGMPGGGPGPGAATEAAGGTFRSKSTNRRFQYWTEIVESLLNIDISELIPGIRNHHSHTRRGQDDGSLPTIDPRRV